MNQILLSEKIYVTPKLLRKKKIYKILFILSTIALLILIGGATISDYQMVQGEAMSQTILDDFSTNNSSDNTTMEEETLVVALNNSSNTEVKEVNEMEQTQGNQNNSNAIVDKFNTVYRTGSGTEYKVDSILNIPSLGINYPVISDCTTELLKISLNKFWGGDANSVGNYCIVGHNYDGKDIFFGKLHRIQNGDIIELQDKTGNTIKYKVYNKFIVEPTDVACTSQLTNGKKEVTLITCSDGGKTRLVVKCREV